jgi:hypothetical protein
MTKKRSLSNISAKISNFTGISHHQEKGVSSKNNAEVFSNIYTRTKIFYSLC